MAQASQMLAWASWGLEKSRKDLLPLLWYPFVFLVKALSDPLLCEVTSVEHHNSDVENQNISE